ncbi:MAG: hypothetical protein RL701_216 [Pseudomonadota bacterium]
MTERLSLLLLSALMALGLSGVQAQPKPRAAPEDVILGEWWTENNEGRVLFTKDRDGTFRGTTTCCVPKQVTPDRPAQDLRNPNPKLRARSTVGIVIIWKLAFEDGEYVGGRVYNPRDGKSYHLNAEVIDHDTVKIRGFVGIPLLGQSQLWKRVRGAHTTATR